MRCLNVLFTFSYFAFVVYEFISITTWEEASVTQKIYVGFVMAMFSFHVFFQLNILWSLREFPPFVQNFMRYSRHFEGNRTSESSLRVTFISLYGLYGQPCYLIIILLAIIFTETYIESQDKPTTLARIYEIIVVAA